MSEKKFEDGKISVIRKSVAVRLAERIAQTDPLNNISMEINKLQQLEEKMSELTDTELGARGVQFRFKFLQSNILARLNFYDSQVSMLSKPLDEITLAARNQTDESESQITSISLRVIDGSASKS